MARKRYYLILLLGIIFFIQSCGNEASPDAVVVSPGDPGECLFTGPSGSSPTFTCGTVGPLVFRVEASSTDTTPVANANVRIDVNGTNEGALLLNRTGTACYNGGTAPILAFMAGVSPIVAPPDCFSVDTVTDNSGVVQFQMIGRLSGCGGATTDIKGTVIAQVTAAASFAISTENITISCSATGTPTTTATTTTAPGTTTTTTTSTTTTT